MRSVLAATFMLAVSSTAMAGSGAAVGVGIAPTIPLGTYNDTNDPGVATAIYVSGPAKGRFDWRVEAAIDRADTNDEVARACEVRGNSCGSDSVRRFVIGGQYNFMNRSVSRFNPYVVAVLGIYNHERHESSPSPFGLNLTRSSSDFGIGTGGGVEVGLGNRWGVGFDLRLNGIFTDEERPNLWYLTPTTTCFVRF